MRSSCLVVQRKARREFLAVLTFLSVVAFPHTSRAELDDSFAPFYVEASDSTVMFLKGPIDARSSFAFSRALDEFPGIRKVVLSSLGGDVYSALTIAREIDKRGLSTEIEIGSMCYSACAFLYLAGHDRQALGSLGVHQISSQDPDMVSGQVALSDILEVLGGFGVPNDVVISMLRTSPDDMYVMTPDELLRYGLTGTRLAGVTVPKRSSEILLSNGTYRNGGLSVVIAGESVGITVTEAGCIGQFDGVVREDESVTAFVGDGCTIDVTKLGPFDFSMDQGPGCSNYHGAACSFTGYVRRQ